MNMATASAILTGPMQLMRPETFESSGDIGIEELREFVPVMRRKLVAGQYLFRAGQPFRALFLVHVGCLKTCELADDGREQVTGFRMRGGLLGVESIGLVAYACDAVALESGEVRERPPDAPRV